ncbi:hypothetical protein [Mycoplana rhizolycopersici]|uniref:Uncharacterized protein n=1 Tax=Mycoplana rhizolycopersici TaxID=2746702 RepID=A0ABX2QC22_9HYPH|nr:hypothetical protein [Rhizobium rhizolycopersici]NVP54529.1 hypothetical protein [Rhizobium rhizolycopersici]
MEITSREYKVGLQAGRFGAIGETSTAAVAECWRDLAQILQEGGLPVQGAAKTTDPAKQRNLHFLDTRDLDLFGGRGLLFRLRRPIASKGDWSATLKFRHGDRLLADAEDFRPSGKGELKFEEDVKPVPGAMGASFWALFSRSAQAKVKSADDLRTLGDCLALFDDIGDLNLPSLETEVLAVGGNMIVEHVFEGLSIVFSDTVTAPCALILWWRDGEPKMPVAAEFSFRFELEEGRTNPKVARGAWRALRDVAASPWGDPLGATKTGFIYG